MRRAAAAVAAILVLLGTSGASGAVLCNDGYDCPLDEYCGKPAGECWAPGTCQPKPEVCPPVWIPVCGCDGRNYGNDCEAAQAGTSVAIAGSVCPVLPPSWISATQGTLAGKVLVTWEDVWGETAYIVYRSESPSGPFLIVGGGDDGVTLFEDFDACGRSGYYYRVTALGGDGESPPSAVAWGFVLNRAPVADAGGPYDTDTGLGLTLDASGSADPDEWCGDSIVGYEWDLNDDGSCEYAGVSPAVPWEGLAGLPQPGVPVPVRLRVTDALGETGTTTTTLVIYVNEPEADFTAVPNPAGCGGTVAFDGSASGHGRPDRAIVSYQWDFDGDGVFDAYGATAAHAYGDWGTYAAALRVTDDNVPPRTDTATLEVEVANRPPEAAAGGPYVIAAGDDLPLDASGSLDPDGGCGDSIVSYEWDLGADGSFEYAGPGPVAPWADLAGLPQPGVPVPVRLRVTDLQGASSSADTTLVIYLNEPGACFEVEPSEAGCNEPVTLDAACSGHGYPGRSIARYEWDFDYDGSFEADAEGPVAEHAFGSVGLSTAALLVTDDNVPPRTDLLAREIFVGRSPVADAGMPALVPAGEGLTLDGRGSSDPDAPCDRIVAYEWDTDMDGAFDDALGDLAGMTWFDVESLVCGGSCLRDVPYPVRLRVTDSSGLQDIAATEVTVTPLDGAVRLLMPDGGEVFLAGGDCPVAWEPDGETAGVRILFRADESSPWRILSLWTAADAGLMHWNVPPRRVTSHDCLVKVVALDAAGERLGADRSDGPFTLGPVDLTAPEKGDRLPGGDPVPVTWSSGQLPAAVERTVLRLTRDRGRNWVRLAVLDGDPGAWEWLGVPQPLRRDAGCRVMVLLKDGDGNIIGKDAGEEWFSILGPLDVTFPEGGDQLTGGDQVSITWNTLDAALPVAATEVRYTVDDARTWNSIGAWNGDPGSCGWTVPVFPEARTECRVKVILRDAGGGPLGVDRSEGRFSILPP